MMLTAKNFNFIEMPNLPVAPVKLALTDGRIDSLVPDFKSSMQSLGISTIKTRKHPGLQLPVAYHPDMFMCHLGGKEIVYAPGTSAETLEILRNNGFLLFRGETFLKKQYPYDIAYNAAIVGRYVFHDFRFTDPVLKEILELKGYLRINVRQGYTKCSIVVLAPNRIITADKGISQAAADAGIESLLIEPERKIILKGYDYGFIGGCTGMIDKNKLAFAGNSGELSQIAEIMEYLEHHGIKIINLGSGNVTDVGSIIPLTVESTAE